MGLDVILDQTSALYGGNASCALLKESVWRQARLLSWPDKWCILARRAAPHIPWVICDDESMGSTSCYRFPAW